MRAAATNELIENSLSAITEAMGRRMGGSMQIAHSASRA